MTPDPKVSHPFDRLLGPFFDTVGLAKWLDVSPESIHGRVIESKILAVQLGNGEFLYPTFQFTGNGSLVPHLMEAVQILSTGLPDVWSRALWVSAKVEDLGDRSVVDLLETGDPRDLDAAMWWVRAETSRLGH
jgi:hypothetical protein